MAMFEMATSYVQFQNTWEPSKASQDLSNEYSDLFAGIDKPILAEIKLDQESDKPIYVDKNVCSHAKEDDEESSAEKLFGLDSYSFDEKVPSFPEGCSFKTTIADLGAYNHKIIFDKNNGLWSCALVSGQSKCDFEDR